MQKKHWVEHLIDGRWLFRREIESIKSLDCQIEELQNKMNRLELERHLQEQEVFEKVRNQKFTIEQITDAKLITKYA